MSSDEVVIDETDDTNTPENDSSLLLAGHSKRKSKNYVATQMGGEPNPYFYPNLVAQGNSPISFTPIVPDAPPMQINKPTFRESLNANFSLYNAPYRGIKYIADRVANQGYTTRELGYDPIKEGILNDVPEPYWSNVLAEPTRELANLVKRNLAVELEDKAISARTGKIVGLVTSMGASVLDPITLIPFAQTVKYASVSKGMLINMLNMAKTAVPAIAMQNAVLVGTKETEGLSDWAYATMFESFLALSIGGALSIYSSKSVKGELANAKAVFKSIESDGIEIKYRLGDKGDVVGKPVAVSNAPEGSVGAMQAEGVQALLDAGHVDFKSNRFVKTVMGWGSPMIKGVTNRSPTIRKLFNQMFASPFEVAGGVADAITNPSAHDFLKVWRSTQAQLGIYAKFQYLEYLKSIGVKGVGKRFKGNFITLEQFLEECGQAYRRGGSDNKFIADVAKAYSDELYKPLWDELKTRYPDMKEEMFTSITQHLNRSYHKGKIQGAPDEFIKDVVSYVTDVNQRVEAYNAPILSNKSLIIETTNALNAAKNKLTKPRIENLIAAEERLAIVNKLVEVENTRIEKLYWQESRLTEKDIEDRLARGLPTEQVAIERPTSSPTLEKLNKEKVTLEGKINSYNLSDNQQWILKDEVSSLKIDLDNMRELEAQLQAKLTEDIANVNVPNNPLTLDMLEGRIDLTGEQLSQLGDIKASLMAAEKELIAAEKELADMGKLKSLKEFLAEDLSGISSSAISDVAQAVEKFGINKTLRAVKKFRSLLVGSEKKLTAESARLRASKKGYNDVIADLRIEARNKKEFIKSLESKLSGMDPKDKKLIRSLKNDIANEKKNLSSIPKLIEDTKAKIGLLNVELDGIKSAKPLEQIAKDVGDDVIDFIGKAVNAQSIDEMIANINEIQKAVKKINRKGLAVGAQNRNAIRRRIRKSKADIQSSKEKILTDIDSGLIPEGLYKQTARGAVLLENTNPNIRRLLTPDEIQGVAESVRNNLTQLNSEQVAGQVFKGVTEGGNDIMQSRVLMWNDELAEKWLVNNIDELSGLYMDQISKRIYLDDVLKEWGVDTKKGMDGIVEHLLNERHLEEASILKKTKDTARDKELKKLGENFEDNKKFVADMYKIYMGNYVDNTSTAFRVTDGMKKFAVATLLGNVPLLQLTEFFSPFFRFTFDEYIMKGLTNTMKRMEFVLSKKMAAGEKTYIRGAFADLNLGINTANGARTQALNGYGSQYLPKTVLERYVTNLSNMSQNVNLANYIMDFQETIVAFAMQGTILRILKKYAAGVPLTKFEISRLDRARLNPKEWAERILGQRGVHATEEGAWVSNFHLWTDQEAARRFRIAIEKGVREVIIKPGPMDVPFGLRDPVTSVFMQFSSYMFAATNNFTIPLITSPDLQKATGMILMIASGAAVDPLRQLAKGEDIDYSFGALSSGAMNNSGLFGWQYNELIKANQIFDLPFLRPLQSDRFKRKFSGILGTSPSGGVADMAANAFSAAINGEMNKRDLRNIGKLTIPFFGSWWAHRPIDAALGAFNYPKSRREAKALKEYDENE